MQFLPRVDAAGLKNEVVMPRASRNDTIMPSGRWACRLSMSNARTIPVGARPEDRDGLRFGIGSRHDSAGAHGRRRTRGLSPYWWMLRPKFRRSPNPYLSRGVDMVSYSAGKYLLRSAVRGLSAGTKDLVQAAWFNSSPHHGLNRTMKVGKEEIMGALAAMSLLRRAGTTRRNGSHWEHWLSHIGRRLSDLPGIRTQLLPPPGVNPHPVLNIEWDSAEVSRDRGRTASDLSGG